MESINDGWKHYDKTIQKARAEAGEFDYIHVTSTGQYPMMGGRLVNYRRGFIICGNFIFYGDYENFDSDGKFCRFIRVTEQFEIFRVLNVQYIKAQLSDSELIKTKAFALDNCCSKCKKQFSTIRGVTTHVNKDNCVFKQFQCFCQQWFKNERGLNMHQKRSGCSSALIENKPLLNKQIRLHKTQIKPAAKERNISNTIHFRCLCRKTTTSEVSFRKHIRTKCPYNTNELKNTVYWRSSSKPTRDFPYNIQVGFAKDDVNLSNYLFGNGQRPINILKDTRMLGFRYIGQRTANMDLTPFMTQTQLNLELDQQKIYEKVHIKTRGIWF